MTEQRDDTETEQTWTEFQRGYLTALMFVQAIYTFPDMKLDRMQRLLDNAIEQICQEQPLMALMAAAKVGEQITKIAEEVAEEADHD